MVRKTKSVTIIDFVDERGSIVYKATFTRERDDKSELQWQSEIPKGYKLKLKPSEIKIKIDDFNKVDVVKEAALPEKPKEDPTPPKTIEEKKPEEPKKEEVNAPNPKPVVDVVETPPVPARPLTEEEKAPIASAGEDIYPESYVPNYDFSYIAATHPSPITGEAKEKLRKKIGNYNSLLSLNSFEDYERNKNELLRKFEITGADEIKNFDAFFKRMFRPDEPGRGNAAENIKAVIRSYEQDWEAYAAKGMVPDIKFWQNYPTVNEAVVWDYAKESDNPVLNHYIKLNKERYFASSTKYMRNPGQLLDNDYYGWTKTDASNSYKELTKIEDRNKVDSNGDKFDDGIRVYKYVPDSDNDAVTNKEPRYLAKLDANNNKGYEKFLKFITDHKEITGVVIENMGQLNQKQDFSEILAKLPSNIKTLTLFFETTDTSALVGLKDKHLEDVELVTKGNNLDSRWAIDPIAFRHTRHVSFDYNVNRSPEYAAGVERAGSIMFNTIKPTKGTTPSEVKEAFTIAYRTKANWKIFNGNFGDGSWASQIDLSEHPELRSLEGLDLNDKVFTALTLHNDTNVFEVDSSTINRQNWDRLIVRGPQKAKLFFEGPRQVDTLYIKGNAVDLPQDYNKQFYGLFEAGREVFRNVYVDNEAMRKAIQDTQAAREHGINVQIKPEGFEATGANTSTGPSFD
ncbi:putative immunoglobulin-blocking virulence protein [Mycoplasma struthionis]|uniref:Putative immunoglobulin-blocking virulence protein n=1 Tax=Mycoplasma struthionis TaxID=538220 RepID=A0A3G8LHB1_9MOLU|nr:putative immunoglobulin-blocking virulence protein [Mycoplasma struthionis]AZG68625.1 putative immunoglobulin-blocking virulence protein [Mycoplasma struthionis]